MLIAKLKFKRGVTLIELMTTVGIAAVVTLSVAVLMTDGIKHWGTMYNRLHSPDADNAYAVGKMFDRLMRRTANSSLNTVSPAGDSAQIYYYGYDGMPDDTANRSVWHNRRADFVWDSGGKILTITCNIVDAKGAVTGTDGVTTIKNVTNCQFKPIPLPSSTFYGRSIQMVLTIQNQNLPTNVTQPYNETLNVCSSAYLHIE